MAPVFAAVRFITFWFAAVTCEAVEVPKSFQTSLERAPLAVMSARPSSIAQNKTKVGIAVESTGVLTKDHTPLMRKVKVNRTVTVQHNIRASGLTDVCKNQVREPPKDVLHVSYLNEENTLCIAGSGYESRAESTSWMLGSAVDFLLRSSVASPALPSFRNVMVNIGDGNEVTVCKSHLAYAINLAKKDTTCKPRLIPDFTLVRWHEAGMKQNYGGMVSVLAKVGSRKPETMRCGWAGSTIMHWRRREFVGFVNNEKSLHNLLEVVSVGCQKCHRFCDDCHKFVPLEEQVRKWACFVDVEGQRVVLSSGKS
eukprot:TRINITY_DN35603_c0_g1_i3.p1 TRINITY_DN35603_c0_g1~~TRINITY_DN35603_c0_g1_i3.p1  ORF type:complete len:323 (+),score=34.36 TRINITY_DN35603_c0_g1_i3:39-971(+)